MRWVARLTCEAHIKMMQTVKVGMRESHLESVAKAFCDQNYFTGKL